jgi:hypothetical protein
MAPNSYFVYWLELGIPDGGARRRDAALSQQSLWEVFGGECRK